MSLYTWRVELFTRDETERKLVGAWVRDDLELPFRPVKGDVIPPASLGQALYNHFGVCGAMAVL